MRSAIPVAYVENIAEIIGGGPMSLLTLVENLDKGRFKPIVVFYASGGLPDRLAASGVEVQIVERRGALSNLNVVLKLARLFRNRKVGLVHVNSLDVRAGLAAIIGRLPLVGHLRVVFPFTWVDRLFVRLATRIVSVSDAARDAFCHGHRRLITKFVTIPNTVHIRENSKSDIRAELRLHRDTQLVAAVSRIDPWKGLETFIQMGAKLKEIVPGIKLLLLGSADRRDPAARAFEEDLQRLTLELGLKDDVFFLGFRNDALDIIKQVDILTVTSRVLKTKAGIKTEGFGRVIIEAMALDTPVVATKVGGIPEIIVNGQSGLLVPPESPAEMAKAVAALLQDQHLREKIIKGGKRRFEDRYRIDQHISSIQTLYEKVLQEHG